jgi:chromosome segregation ATPase
LEEADDMTNDEFIAIRTILREEINAAVYASEQRMGDAIKASEQRMGDAIKASEQRTGERFDKLETMMEFMTRDLILMKAELREVRGDLREVQSDLKQVVSVLDTATSAINELQDAQRALDVKVTYAVQALNARIDKHERTPIDKAHPRPGSAV